MNHPLLDLFNKENRESREELPHPISMDQSVMRTSLIPQLVESLGRNHSRQINEACFYELGRVFNRVDGAPVQTETVSLGMMGRSADHCSTNTLRYPKRKCLSG